MCGCNLLFIFCLFPVSKKSFVFFPPAPLSTDCTQCKTTKTTLDQRKTLHKLEELTLKTAMVTANLQKALHRSDLLLTCTEKCLCLPLIYPSTNSLRTVHHRWSPYTMCFTVFSLQLCGTCIYLDLISLSTTTQRK